MMKYFIIVLLIAFIFWVYSHLNRIGQYKTQLTALRKELHGLNTEFNEARAKWGELMESTSDLDVKFTATQTHQAYLKHLSGRIEDVMFRIAELDKKISRYT